MEKGNKQLLSKISIAFVIVVLALVVSIGITMVWSAKSMIKHSYMAKATLTAEVLVENIDIDKYEQLAKNPQENELYFELQTQLTDMLEINPITYMYVAIAPPASQVGATTLVDAGALNSEDVYHIGEPLEDVDYHNIIEGLKKEGSYSEFDTIEETGDIITSYVPLKNANGEIFAILGVDDTLVTIGDIQIDALKDVLPLLITVIVVISVAIMASVGFYLYRLLNPIGYLREATFKLDEGNIVAASETMETVDLRRDSSITIFARAFKSMIHNLRDMLRSIRRSSEDVLTTTNAMKNVSHMIDTSTQSLMTSIDEISGSVQQQEQISEEMTVAMQRMTDGVQQITMQVQRVVENLQTTSTAIHHNSREAADVSQQVQNMSAMVGQTASSVQHLAENYNEIESMIEIIQSIADQTNLLALNASIEAARAGEHGLGFAVVADEVRKLAELTKGSAHDIRVQIVEFKAITENVLQQMTSSATEVNAGAKHVQSISEGLQDVRHKTEQVVADVQVVENVTTAIGETVEVVNVAIERANLASQRVMQGTDVVQEAANTQGQTVVQLRQSIDQLTQTVAMLEGMLKKYTV